MSRSTATATQSGSRKKATKAVVAGAIGIALLAGGGGSFARWYDSEAISSGSTITNGALALDQVADTGKWTFNGDPVATATDVAALRVVPGDVLQYTETVKVTAEGDALAATLTTTASTLGRTFEGLIIGQTYTRDGVVADLGTTGIQITPEDDGDQIAVAITITFPEFQNAEGAGAGGADGHAGWWGQDGQGATLTLSDVSVILEQNDRA